MKIVFVEKPTCENVVEAVSQDATADSLALIVLGEKCGVTPAALRERLLDRVARFAGWVTPGVLYGHRVYPDAAWVCHVPCLDEPVAVLNLEQRASDLPVALLRWAEHPDWFRDGTLLVLVDGLAQGVSSLLADVGGMLGPHIRYLGGGAAYSDLVQRPCLFSRDGVFADAALFVPLRLRAAFNVQHGWKRVGAPMIITRSVAQTIHELNWRPAFDVYREALRTSCGQDVTRENFPAVSQYHPLGILREDDEELVRDPIRVEEGGSLFCVGAVPENATVSVMEGTPQRLIDAAEKATAAVFQDVKPGVDGILFLIDCVSRWLCLRERFSEELETIHQAARRRGLDSHRVAGFLSFGEIAASPRGRVDFYNKTVVVAVCHE